MPDYRHLESKAQMSVRQKFKSIIRLLLRGWHALDGIYSKYFRGPFEYQFNIFCSDLTHKLLSRLLSWVFYPHSTL